MRVMKIPFSNGLILGLSCVCSNLAYDMLPSYLENWEGRSDSKILLRNGFMDILGDIGCE
jgi:hypothetical protein